MTIQKFSVPEGDLCDRLPTLQEYRFGTNGEGKKERWKTLTEDLRWEKSIRGLVEAFIDCFAKPILEDEVSSVEKLSSQR